MQLYTRSPRPKHKGYKAQIELRFCYECNEINPCFTGKANEYCLTDIGNSFLFFNNKKTLEKKLREIEMKQENKLKFFFLDFFDKYLEKEKFLRNSLRKLLEAEAECEKLYQLSHNFYTKTKPKARCLKCNTHNISNLKWSEGRCKCGGKFEYKEEKTGVRIAYAYFEFYEYDNKGFSVLIKKRF